MGLGTGCLPDDPEPSSSGSLSVSIVSDYSWDTGATGTAAAVVTGNVGAAAFQWSITAPGTIVGGAGDSVVSFTSSTASAATLLVTVTDSITGDTTTNAYEVRFQGTTPSQPLAVDAGQDQTVAVGNTVLLLGSASGGSGSYSYLWRQASGPAQDIAGEYSTETAAITVIGKTPGTAVFELIVRDYLGETVTKTVKVVVTASPN